MQLQMNFEAGQGRRSRRPGAGRKAIELTGQRFGRWTVVERAAAGPGGHIKWSVRCDCGADGLVSGDGLRLGRSRSCGCMGRDLSRERMRELNRRKLNNSLDNAPLRGEDAETGSPEARTSNDP